MDVTEQERQMIEMIREQSGTDEYRLVIERIGGTWEIATDAMLRGKQRSARGVGTTFDRAWDNMAPTWA
jgi:hypothetical protein